MNGVYIRKLAPDDFAQRALPFLDKGLPATVKRPLSADYVKQVLPLIQERARTLTEIAELTEFFFVEELNYPTEMLIGKNMTREATIGALQASQPLIEAVPFEIEPLESAFRPLSEKLGLKTGQFFGVLRVAFTGRTVSPPLFQTMAVLGRKQCLKRLQMALAKLAEP